MYSRGLRIYGLAFVVMAICLWPLMAQSAPIGPPKKWNYHWVLVKPLYTTSAPKKVASISKGQKRTPGISKQHNAKARDLKTITDIPLPKTSTLGIRLAKAEKKAQASDNGHAYQARVSLAHQILGIASMVTLASAVVVGQINMLDSFNNRLSDQSMLWIHRGTVIGTSATYLGARILAWMMPSLSSSAGGDGDLDGGEEDDEEGGSEEGTASFDSSKWHRILAWIHGFGMLGVIITGLISARLTPGATTAKLAVNISHLTLGYVTLGALTGAFVVITFY